MSSLVQRITIARERWSMLGGHALVTSRKTYACGSGLLLWVITSYCCREPTRRYLGVVKTLFVALACLCPPAADT